MVGYDLFENEVMSGTGGEPHPDKIKVKGPVLLDRMGGEALQRPNVPP